MIQHSLKWRVTASILVVLIFGFSWLLQIARDSIEQSMEVVLKQDLTGRLYGLLANADFDVNQNSLSMNERFSDPAFNRPGSGYSAFLMNQHHAITWFSASSDDMEFSSSDQKPLGIVDWFESPSHYSASLSFEWSSGNVISGPWTLVVKGNKRLMLAPIDAFMKELYVGFLYVGLGVISVLIILMVWQWRPVNRLEEELRALETSEKTSIQSTYPRELDRLVRRLNAYIAHSQHQTESTRHYLENLAHNLKTPLAVLRSCSESHQLDLDMVVSQVDRMDSAIKVAVQKAQAANRPLVVKPLAVRVIVDRMMLVILRARLKAEVTIENKIDETLRWMIEEGDAFELFGNILDNAVKYGAKKILVHSHAALGVVYIDDDGPGIAPDMREIVLERGARIDQRVEGEGIGLSIVAVMLEAYQGKIYLDESPLGGLRVAIELPSVPLG